jgi:hypothetical protein
VVNLRAAPDATASSLMFGVFAVLAAVGSVASYRSGRGRAP